MAKLARTIYPMGGGASTAILHGCHRQNIHEGTLPGGDSPAATARLDVGLGREGDCVRGNGAPTTSTTMSSVRRRRGDGCHAVSGQRLERQRTSSLHSGSTRERCGRHGIGPSSTLNAIVDESTSSNTNQLVTAATVAEGEEKSTRSSSLENDHNGAMTKAEAARWLDSRQASPVSCSMTDVGCPTVTTVDLSDSTCDGGPISSKWQSTPTCGSGKPGHPLCGKMPSTSENVETSARVRGNGEHVSRSHGTTSVDGTKYDDKPCRILSTLTAANSTSDEDALSRAPNAYCCPTNGVQSTSRKPRRDSFSASLQAAINKSSLTLPTQLSQTHREGSDGRSSSAATTAAAKGPQLQLPRNQHRNSAFTNSPTITMATLRGADEQLSGRIHQKGFRPGQANRLTGAIAKTKESQEHRQLPSYVEVNQTSCSSWMNDEEWLQVCHKPNQIRLYGRQRPMT